MLAFLPVFDLSEDLPMFLKGNYPKGFTVIISVFGKRILNQSHSSENFTETLVFKLSIPNSAAFPIKLNRMLIFFCYLPSVVSW